jgi:hypothetical protein
LNSGLIVNSATTLNSGVNITGDTNHILNEHAYINYKLSQGDYRMDPLVLSITSDGQNTVDGGLLINIDGNITPNSNDKYNLGSNNKKWKNIYATTFNGNASTADKLNLTQNPGNPTTPVYFDNGLPTVCDPYAGGTKVSLNNEWKGSSTASFYAPTDSGDTGQVLVSSGSGAPKWKSTNW